MVEASARPIGFGTALAEQLRWFWRRLWLWIVVVAVLTSATAAWIIGSVPQEQSHFAFLIVGNAFHPLLVLIAISWALSAWRDDPPKDRQYFWLQPVSRTGHTAARSVAGLAWLLAVVAFIIAVVLVTIVVSHGADAILGTPRFWAYVAGAIGLAYVASSIPAVLTNKPGLWLVAAVALVILANVIATIRDLAWLESALSAFQGGKYSFGTALGAPGVEAARIMSPELTRLGATEAPQMAKLAEAAPGTALLIWIPIALVLYYVAAGLSRPR